MEISLVSGLTSLDDSSLHLPSIISKSNYSYIDFIAKQLIGNYHLFKYLQGDKFQFYCA